MTKKQNTVKPAAVEKKAAATPAKANANALEKPVARKPAKPAKAQSPKAKPAGFKLRKPDVTEVPVAPVSTISSEDIALRAYYIGEKRQKLGLPGDSAQDWLEAERQLSAEARLARKAPKA